MSSTDQAPVVPRSATLRVLRPVRGRLLAAAALQGIGAALVLAPLVGVGELAQVLLAPNVDTAHARQIVAVSAAGLALGFALRGTGELVAELADNRLALWLRRAAADAIARAGVHRVGGRSTEQLQSVMRDDVATLHQLVAHHGPDVVRAVVTVGVVGAYLTSVAWELALALLVPVAAYLWLYRWMMRGSAEKMVTYGRALRDISDAVGSFAQGIAVVKSYGATGRSRSAHNAYLDASRRFNDFFLGWARSMVVPETVSVTVVSPLALVLLTTVVGTALLAAGRVTAIDLLPFLVLAPSMSAPLTALTVDVRSLQLGRGAANRIAGLLAVSPLAEPAAPVVPRDSRLTLDRVSFGYDERQRVLQDVSLTIEPGTLTAIVGPSGSGKSTLAALLLRLADPDRGTVYLGGVPLYRVAAEERSRRVGAVFQECQLLRASVRDNLTLGRPDATEGALVAAARAAQIHHRVTELPHGYDTVIGGEVELSGGEAQRLSIARALLLDPEVLVLDEPTSAADPRTQHAIRRAFAAALTRQGRPRTAVVIAHRLETITNADQIVVLDRGRIIQQGTHEQLRDAPGRYRQLWQAQHAGTDGGSR